MNPDSEPDPEPASVDRTGLDGLIGIDLGATNVRIARIEGGDIVELRAEPIIRSAEPQDLIGQIEGMITQVIDPDVRCIGIGVPSVVDPVKGIVYDVQNIPSWTQVPLGPILERRFGVPVAINNDANCFALGEWAFGAGARSSGDSDPDSSPGSLVGLIVGTGFGAGLVLNGRLWSGENCGAGEVGMLPYRDSIYEHYCSGQFFERSHGVGGRDLHARALDGDPAALAALTEFGEHLGMGIQAVLYAFDPGLIVLGGSVSGAFPLFEASMRRALESFAYPRSLESLRIEVSTLEHPGVLGAAVLALDAGRV